LLTDNNLINIIAAFYHTISDITLLFYHGTGVNFIFVLSSLLFALIQILSWMFLQHQSYITRLCHGRRLKVFSKISSQVLIVDDPIFFI